MRTKTQIDTEIATLKKRQRELRDTETDPRIVALQNQIRGLRSVIRDERYEELNIIKNRLSDLEGESKAMAKLKMLPISDELAK